MKKQLIRLAFIYNNTIVDYETIYRVVYSNKVRYNNCLTPVSIIKGHYFIITQP